MVKTYCEPSILGEDKFPQTSTCRILGYEILIVLKMCQQMKVKDMYDSSSKH